MITPADTVSRRIFPIRCGTKGIPIGPPFDETGRPVWKPLQERDSTSDEVRAWGRITEPHGWALVLGRASGFVVLDLDPRNGADPAAVAGTYAIPRTFTVCTPSGGLHWYFWHPAGFRSDPTFAPGVELRADGNIVLIPPSRRDGRKYEVVDEIETAPLPPRLLACAAAAVHTGHIKARMPETEVAALLRGVDAGARNTTAARLAGHWLAKGIAPAEALELLRGWNGRNHPPLPDTELVTVVSSIAATHGRNHTQVRLLE